MYARFQLFRDLLFGISLYVIIPLLVLVQWFVIFVCATLLRPLSYILNSLSTLIFFCSLAYFVLHGRHPVEFGFYMMGVAFAMALLPMLLDRALDWFVALGTTQEFRA
jgi:hypothetical protein